MTPQPICVISFGGGFNLPLWAARDHGFFAQHGLAATLQVTPDSRNVFTGLMEGRYHVAITAFDNIVAYQEGQGEVKFDPPSDFFAFMGSDDGFLSLVAVPGVTAIPQLKGRTLSVDAMSNGFSFVLREMLARNGVAESDVQWARAGGTDRRFAALMAQQHDATMLRAPFDLQARNRGFHQLATAREAIGPYLGIVGAAAPGPGGRLRPRLPRCGGVAAGARQPAGRAGAAAGQRPGHDAADRGAVLRAHAGSGERLLPRRGARPERRGRRAGAAQPAGRAVEGAHRPGPVRRPALLAPGHGRLRRSFRRENPAGQQGRAPALRQIISMYIICR
jgi:hypothetical protein